MTSAVNQRFFSDAYDGWRQRELAAQIDPKEYRDGYLARHRLDSLLAQHIVLRDTSILDGAFYLAVDPAVLLPSLGRGDALRICARAPTLEQSLMALWKGPGERLYPFLLSSVRSADARNAHGGAQ